MGVIYLGGFRWKCQPVSSYEKYLWIIKSHKNWYNKIIKDFFINAKLGLNMYAAHSECVGVDK